MKGRLKIVFWSLHRRLYGSETHKFFNMQVIHACNVTFPYTGYLQSFLQQNLEVKETCLQCGLKMALSDLKSHIENCRRTGCVTLSCWHCKKCCNMKTVCIFVAVLPMHIKDDAVEHITNVLIKNLSLC